MEKEIIYFFGGLISFLLSINAFFGRKTIDKLASLDLKVAVLIQKHDATDERSRQNATEIEKLWDRTHKLEGGQLQVLSWLESMDKTNK